LLEADGGLKAKELAEKCEVSERQIYRDIKALKAAKVPIYFAKEEGYKIMPVFFLPPLRFSLVEALAILLGCEAFSKHKGTPYHRASETAVSKIIASLPSNIKNTACKSVKSVLYDTAPIVDYTACQKIFANLEEARRSKRSVEINYYTMERHELTKRLINPYGLIYRVSTWYLVAYCHWRKEILMFRIDRIKELKETSKNFEIPSSFSLEEYMGDAWQVVRGKSQFVRLRFSSSIAERILENKWHRSQILEVLKDGSVIMTIQVGGLSEVISWILGFGKEVEVLEPKELREMVAETAKAILEVNRFSLNKNPGQNL